LFHTPIGTSLLFNMFPTFTLVLECIGEKNSPQMVPLTECPQFDGEIIRGRAYLSISFSLFYLFSSSKLGHKCLNNSRIYTEVLYKRYTPHYEFRGFSRVLYLMLLFGGRVATAFNQNVLHCELDLVCALLTDKTFASSRYQTSKRHSGVSESQAGHSYLPYSVFRSNAGKWEEIRAIELCRLRYLFPSS